MEKYDNEEIFRIAAVLDPRWKLRWCKGDEVTELKHIILKGVESLVIQVKNLLLHHKNHKIHHQEKKSKLFEFMHKNVAISAKECSDGLISEVNEYLSGGTINEDDDPLSFWSHNRHRYPVLSKLACRYLQTPASSGPVERLFSITGKMFRPDRCRLNDDLFEK